MTSRSRPSPRAAGFTLLEMLVVLAILGLALGLFAHYAPSRTRPLDLRIAAGQVADILRQGRARAIAGNRVVRVGFDAAAPAVVLDGAQRRFAPPVSFAVTTRPGLAAGAAAAIVFAPDGSSSGGFVSMTDGHRTMRVEVDWLTGRVRVADAP